MKRHGFFIPSSARCFSEELEKTEKRVTEETLIRMAAGLVRLAMHLECQEGRCMKG
ncbi:MAG: hypothetical protein N2234_06325 [Planctomycetota bacterium]|nr:hypothetical protein [Planctomycetota bacterium]